MKLYMTCSGALVAALLLLAGCDGGAGEQPIGLSSRTPKPAIAGNLPSAKPTGNLGHNAALDRLARECHDGILQSCDDLIRQSEPDSPYESYGTTCGGRNEATGSCVKMYGVFSTNTSIRAGPARGTPIGRIGSAAISGHDPFDRFILEFGCCGTPAYQVAFTAETSVKVAGDKNLLKGVAILLVRVYSTSWPKPLPVRLPRTDTANILEVALMDTTGGAVTWAVALNRKTGFEVSGFDSPPRLAIDISRR
jgi:hypothetical protein